MCRTCGTYFPNNFTNNSIDLNRPYSIPKQTELSHAQVIITMLDAVNCVKQ